MAQGDLRVLGGTPAAGLDIELRPPAFLQKLGALLQLFAWGAALGVPVALLRGGPRALLAALAATLVLHGMGYVMRHAVQHLVVAPGTMLVRSEHRIGNWRLPRTSRAVAVTPLGAVLAVREHHRGDPDGPRWQFVVRVLPDERGSHSESVFASFDAGEAMEVAAQLGQTLAVPARDRISGGQD